MQDEKEKNDYPTDYRSFPTLTPDEEKWLEINEIAKNIVWTTLGYDVRDQ